MAEICAVDLALMFGAQIDVSILNLCGVPGGNQGSIFAINPFVLTQLQTLGSNSATGGVLPILSSDCKANR